MEGHGLRPHRKVKASAWTGAALAWCLAAGFALTPAHGADADPAAEALPTDVCREAATAVGAITDVPAKLLSAISRAETGRRLKNGRSLEAWPWTIHAAGSGYYFDTKAEAVRTAKALMAAGNKSIDVGCMQINMFYHGHEFDSIEEAFDPYTNVTYAAQFLNWLHGIVGSWEAAVPAYHSRADKDRARRYAERVTYLWTEERHQDPACDAVGAAGLRPGLEPVETVTGAARRVAAPTACGRNHRLKTALAASEKTGVRPEAVHLRLRAAQIEDAINLADAARAIRIPEPSARSAARSRAGSSTARRPSEPVPTTAR